MDLFNPPMEFNYEIMTEEIDIENWKPSSTQENQYFAVKINNDDKNYYFKIFNYNIYI